MKNGRRRRAGTTGARWLVLLWSVAAAEPSSAQSAPAAGVTLAHTEQRAITSSKIGQRYDLLVSLPHDYATSGRRYPVLYVLDGWHFPLMTFLQNNNIFSERMPPVIVVNISHRDRNFNRGRLSLPPERRAACHGPEG